MWTIPTIPTVVAPYTDDTYFKGVTGANLEDAYHSCVLRIRCDDEGAKINLGLKYGADDGDVPGLLALAKSLGLQVCMCVVCVIVRARVSCPGMVGMFHMCM